MLRVSVDFLCPAEPKNFAGEPFCGVLQKVYGSEKLYEQEGGGSIKILRQKFLSHSAEKFRR